MFCLSIFTFYFHYLLNLIEWCLTVKFNCCNKRGVNISNIIMTDHVLYGIKVSQSVTIIEWDQVKFCISKIDLIIANITAKGVYFGAF